MKKIEQLKELANTLPFTDKQRHWLLELLSEKHRQGKHYLMYLGSVADGLDRVIEEEFFCCLGVASKFTLGCELESKQRSALTEEEADELFLVTVVGNVKDWATRETRPEALYELNDNQNKSFVEIAAQLIEHRGDYFYNFKLGTNEPVVGEVMTYSKRILADMEKQASE